MKEREIFFGAVEIATAEARAAYLQAACGLDVTLRCRVEELLREHFSNDSLLAGPALGGGRTAIAESPARETPLGVIGRYKLLQKIGEGGSGIVYMAEQLEPVRRRVALKVVKLGMDTHQVIARFEAERQALAMMDHPNIAKVFDAGATDTGRPYFVMELVRGAPITRFCNERHLSLRERLHLFVQVCQAIQHAHQKGIIHRDIKPSNILVTLNDGVPVPKVIDFGIAKATAGSLTDRTMFTMFEQFIGTPAYMSPEQAEVRGVDIDTRTDIYSLGVVLYELMTGRTPFDSKSLLERGIEELILTLRQVEPPRPSTRLSSLSLADLETVARSQHCEAPKLIQGLRGDLDWIVMKCLEKDRARRYETANALAGDVERHLKNEPVVARPPTTTYRLQKAFQRHRVSFLAAAGVAAALVLGLVISLRQAVRATRAEALASRRLAEAEGISTFLIEVFQSPDPARDGRTITVAETLDTAAKRLESDLAGQPARRAQMQATLGRTYSTLGLPGEAVPLLKKAYDHHRAALGSDHPDTLTLMYYLGLACFEAGRLDEAVQLQEDLLARRRRTNGPESPEAILAMLSLATSYGGARRAEDALALRQEGLRLSRKVNGPEHPDTIKALHGLAMTYPHAQALPLREEALALSRKVNGPDHPSTFRAANNLELSYSAVGRDQDALKLREELVRLSNKLNGPEHRLTLQALDRLERAYYATGRWQDAIQIKADHARWDPKDLNATLPVVQLWFGRDDDYAATCRRLLKFVEGTRVPTTAERVAKACLLRPVTDPAQLEQSLVLARRAVELGADHQFAGLFQLALGMAEYRRGDYRAANKALRAAERKAPVNARFFLAMILFHQVQAVEARRLFDLAAAEMPPLPDDDLNPLARGASGDDMIAWLAYKEAKALLGIKNSGPPSVTAWVSKLQESVAQRPGDTIQSLHLALVLCWSGRSAEHELLCRQMLNTATASKDPVVHDRAAKAYLLRPRPEPETLKLAAASARQALALAKTGDPNLPWFLTVAGGAACREGKFAEAETLLSKAIESPFHENQRRLALAFRAMTRRQAGRPGEARTDLEEIEKANLPIPDRTRMSAILREQDQLAVRLAYDEAKAQLAEMPPATVTGTP